MMSLNDPSLENKMQVIKSQEIKYVIFRKSESRKNTSES